MVYVCIYTHMHVCVCVSVYFLMSHWVLFANITLGIFGISRIFLFLLISFLCFERLEIISCYLFLEDLKQMHLGGFVVVSEEKSQICDHERN